jgi:hypothetical protein
MGDDGTEAISVEMKVPVSGSNHLFVHDNQPLAGFLNADRNSDLDKLSTIADFFRGDKQEFTDIDLLQAVRHIEAKLGTPQLNERRVDQILRYVTIQKQMDSLEKERDNLLR